jgi:hypothetical protein
MAHDSMEDGLRAPVRVGRKALWGGHPGSLGSTTVNPSLLGPSEVRIVRNAEGS